MGVNDLVGGSKVENGLHWLKDTNTDVSECMYIGDTNADYETAAALGIQNITLVSLGHQSYERLKKLHDQTVQTFAEVII